MKKHQRKAIVLFALLACSAISGCSSSGLSDSTALEKLRTESYFPLTADDVRVVGISDGESERIVKATVGWLTMNVKFRHYDRGWLPEKVERNGAWVDLKPGIADVLIEVEREAYEDAIGSLRAIAAAQGAFASTCGSGFYASTIGSLVSPSKATNQAFISTEGMVPLDDGQFERKGYILSLEASPEPSSPASCNGVSAGTMSREFQAVATPKGHAQTVWPTLRVGPDGVLRR